MSSSYRLELDRWLSELDVKADYLLDIGGSQLLAKGRTKSWEVNEYFISDLKFPHADSPKPDIEFDMNKDVISQIGPDVVGIYDFILCLEVFDYIWNPLVAFDNIKYLLIRSGVAWVTFPSFYPHHNPIEDDSLRYMEGGIRKLAQASGLTIKQMIKRRPETDLINRLWTTERMRAAKHYDHLVTGFIVEFTK